MLVCSFYLAVRKEANSHLVDGTGHRPHYSLRTLCRALKYVAANPCHGVQRSLYEVGCSIKSQSTEVQNLKKSSVPPVILRHASGFCLCWKKFGLFQCFAIILTCCDSVTLFLSPSPACVPCWYAPWFFIAGFLPELLDPAGQKFPPFGPETGVSAHPDGEH